MIGRNESAAASSHPQRPNQYQGAPSDVSVEVVWDQITDTPTTLAGYGITDAYTMTEVDGLLALKVDKATLTTRGDLFVRDATVVTRLGIGTAGKVLRSDGTDPSWQTLVPGDISGFNEQAEDAVGNILTDSSTIDFSYVDGSDQITASVIASALSIAYTQLTYSGLTSGQALVASGATSAAFRALTAADIGAGTFGAGDFVFPSDLNVTDLLKVGTLGTELTSATTATIMGLTRIHAHRYANPGQLAVSRSNGSSGSPTTVLNNEQLGNFVFGGYDGTALGAHSSLICFAAENWAVGAHGFRFVIATVPPGTASATTAVTIDEFQGMRLIGSLAAADVEGFFGMPSIASAPSGAPTAYTGSRPHAIDITNLALWHYTGSVWNPVYSDRATTITYSGTMATDAALGHHFSIVVTNGTAMTMSAPTHATAGRTITYQFLNSSGGAMGAITWNAAFKLAGAFTNPANTKTRTITFRYDGTSWFEVSRAAADI